MPNSPEFYPKLTDLISIDQLPIFLQGITGGVQDKLDKLFYSEFFQAQSYFKDKAHYRLNFFVFKTIYFHN